MVENDSQLVLVGAWVDCLDLETFPELLVDISQRYAVSSDDIHQACVHSGSLHRELNLEML